MARTLDELVTSFGAHNAEFGDLKKTCDKEKAEIKDIMLALGQSQKTAGGWTVTCTPSTRETMNEEQLLQVLKENWEKQFGTDCPYIKTREYVDMEALEAGIYAGEVSTETLLEMDKCRNVTEVVTLRCCKAKPKKKEE